MPGRPRPAGFIVVICLIAVSSVIPAGAQEPPPTHRPPVDAPVVDPFRPPASRYGSGNRGLEYGTAPGSEVRATADGVVVFAGRVAGSSHVTVRHGSDVRVSYSFLARVEVVVGQRVSQGDLIGTTEGHLHLGARVGDTYFDPATLFGAGPVSVRLVPFDLPPGPGITGERSAIGQLVGGLGRAAGGVGRTAAGAAGHLVEGGAATVRWLRDDGGQLLRTAAHYLEPPPLRLMRVGVDIVMRADAVARRECTSASAAVGAPTERRLAVTVGGLGSTSENAAIDDLDTERLGYAEYDTVRFSYRGGRTPAHASGELGAVGASSYAPPDTQVDLRVSGARLADLVEEVIDQADGSPVDVFAHSQGGLVARLALIELERRHGPGWLGAHVGVVGLLAVPNGGADLATAVHAIGSTPAGSLVFDVLGPAVGLDDDLPSAAQLGETSTLVEDLRETPAPPGVDVVSVAARGDLVVPSPRTRAPGATEVVVPVDGASAHDALPGSPQARRELALALAGLPPTCQSFGDALADGAIGEAISWGEDQLGAAAWLATLGGVGSLAG